MQKIAKLAIQSTLPQLDRLFDYLIPEHLEEGAVVGARVKVLFGSSKKPIDGFICEISDHSDYQGQLGSLIEVVGDGAVLLPEILELCKQLSERAACTLGEVLKMAIPAHMPRSFANRASTIANSTDNLSLPALSLDSQYIERLSQRNGKHFLLLEPRISKFELGGQIHSEPAWTVVFSAIAASNLKNGKSTIILVPDYREHEVLLRVLKNLGLADFIADYSQEQAKSKQYLGFLKALDKTARIIIGSRLAAFAPANQLSSILVFDEADRSYGDQSAPYLSTREVVLVRQAIQGCSVVFGSHSVSTDMQRLIDSEYLADSTQVFVTPKISISEPGLRIDSHAYKAIKQALGEGPVLVQVSSLGDSTALYCRSCDKPASCKSCQGPLWIDGAGNTRCRWCNGFASNYRCDCGSVVFSSGRAGSTRTAAELGKAFPNARVIESTGEKRITTVSIAPALVVATAGAEPYAEGGYSAVVILDANVLMGRPNLRALEEAVRLWSNAIAKGSAKSQAVLVGVQGKTAQLFSLWNQKKIAEEELASRYELKLPPAIRMGSITGELGLVTAISEKLASETTVVRIGPAPVEKFASGDQWRLILKYPYSKIAQLSSFLKIEVAKISAGKKRVTGSGRSARPLTVKMNDTEVV